MPTISKYGVQFDDTTHPLEMERYCIRQGGRWTWPNGVVGGMGLFYHFRAMQSIIWPEDDHHRWSDLILQTILDNRITVVAGCRDSSKTRTVSKFALCDYWCWPNETLILMTSTTAQGLELRVWGDIKNLFERAKEHYDFLEGCVVDAKKGVFTDDISDSTREGRDMRKGIIGIPCMTSEGEYAGQSLKNFAGIKQKRRRLIGDECFPAGTPVNTPKGIFPIETMRPGDLVFSASGLNRVVVTSERETDTLIQIRTKDKRELVCTWSHPILTHLGWKMACEIHEGHYIMGFYESMQELWKRNQEQDGVFSEVLLRMDENARGNGEALHRGEASEGEYSSNGENELRKQPDENRGVPEEGQFRSQSIRNETVCAGRERNWSHQSRVAVDEDVSGRSMELRNKNREVEWKRNTSGLQSGSSISTLESGYRSRRVHPHELGQPKTEGREKGQVLSGSWVESVEILKQGDPGFPKSDSDSGGCRVYNLQVEGHPSYSVNGFIVHNCQFIPTDYLKVLDSMDKGEFKGVFLGNMIADNGKALDRVSEPADGWTSINDAPKTKVWKNKYNGVTINLCGPDSPNFDEATKDHYPYLLSQSDINSVAARPGGKDTVEWWSQIMGLRKSGVVSDRVLTIDMIQNNGGFKDCIWNTSPTIKILAIDAGYGGDECVATYIECGTEVGGQEVIVFKEQKVYPVLISSPVSAEDQIANAAKLDADRYGVPYEHVYIEAGMRATLAVSFGRILSPEINAINFGGTATQRPVSNDLFIHDERTQQRRLKMCSEHYSKFVTELAFSVRAVVESGQARLFPMPAAEEFQKRKWRFVYGDRYELESKIEYKERNQSKSPNYSDSAMIAVEAARRLGFVIERLKDPNFVEPDRNDWLEEEISSYRKFQRKHELSYD